MEELATIRDKEGTTHSWRARDVGPLATLGTFAHAECKKDGCGTPGLVLHNLREPPWTSGLKEEVAGVVGVLTVITESQEMKVRPITDITSTICREVKMTLCLNTIRDK